jgi:hypothetical protein
LPHVTKKLNNNEILGRVEDTRSPATVENAIARSQEKTRSSLVFCLLGLIVLVLILSVYYFKPSADEGWNFAKTIITSLLGLLGTAIGFYFSHKK